MPSRRSDHTPITLSRRALLTGAAALGGATLLPANGQAGPLLRRAPDAAANLIGNPSFDSGVMAGVPRTDGATLWTRATTGLLGLPGNGPLTLIVSTDENLSNPAIATTVNAIGSDDGTVHFDVTGLAAGEQYYYQFRGRGSESPVGRFRTLRPADSNEPVRIGWFTCQGYEEGYYGTHRHMAEDDLDLVVCLGDYVYEFTAPGVRGLELNAYPQVLEQMRWKYRKYRGDADLRHMHSRHAFLPIWDDHEFRNNYYRNGWTFPVLAPIDTAFGFQQKKQWAWQAWFEHMPVPRFATDPLRTYRSMQIGRTVELFAEDARQYRDIQGCGDSIGHILCADADAPGRSMLGPAQKQWLTGGLANSGAHWKVLANANMMMGMTVADNGMRAYMDTWDGYGSDRRELLSHTADKVANFVVVTGDDHDGYAGELWDTGFAAGSASGEQVNEGGTRRAGVEFVVPSVTSSNTGDGGVPGAHAEEASRRAKNPHLKHIDMVSHGYGVLEATRDECRFQFRRVDKLDRNSGVTTTKTLRTPSGQAVLEDA